MRLISTDLQSQSSHPLRLINTNQGMMHIHHIPDLQDESSGGMSDIDPRWVFAARVQTALGGRPRVQSISQYQELVIRGTKAGFSDLHSKAIIAIAEQAQQRGGLDRITMNELEAIPAVLQTEAMSNKARWITFGVLFSWSLLIAGMMQIVA